MVANDDLAYFWTEKKLYIFFHFDHHWNTLKEERAEKKKKSEKEDGLTELKICVKVEVEVLGSPSLTVGTVSVDIKQHWTGQTGWA